MALSSLYPVHYKTHSSAFVTGNCPQRRFKTMRAATATMTNATAMMRITATTPPTMAAVLLLLVESVVDIPVESVVDIPVESVVDISVESVVDISHSATLRDGSEQSVNTGKGGLSLLNRMCNYIVYSE